MMYLRQSTASQSVLIGPFVDSTDGATAETGLTIANTDIRISKNGANIVAKNSGGATHDEAGWYSITLDATDTDTVGRLQVHCKMSGALMVHAEFHVLEEAAFDALFAASAPGPVTSSDLPANFGDLSITATTGRVDVASIEGSDATDQINAACDTALTDYDAPTKAELDAGFAALNDPTAAAIADAVLDEALSGHTTAGSLGKAVADIETDATAILADTNELQTNQGNWLTATGFSTLDAAGVRTAVGLASANLDTQLSTIDTVADGIKAKTDLLTFTVSGVVDSNLQRINDVALTGDGSGTPFDVA